MKVADALSGTHVIEFYEAPDWYQLRFVVGERNPEHRFRHERCAGEGWSTWRRSGRTWINRWSALPCRLVPIAESERDPNLRMTVTTEES